VLSFPASNPIKVLFTPVFTAPASVPRDVSKGVPESVVPVKPVPVRASVPVASGSVIVRLVLVAGDSMVNVAVPVAAPLMAILLMYYS
jgi:hypothetical protein